MGANGSSFDEENQEDDTSSSKCVCSKYSDSFSMKSNLDEFLVYKPPPVDPDAGIATARERSPSRQPIEEEIEARHNTDYIALHVKFEKRLKLLEKQKLFQECLREIQDEIQLIQMQLLHSAAFSG